MEGSRYAIGDVMIKYRKPDRNQVNHVLNLLKKAEEEPEPFTSWAWEDGEIRLQTTVPSVAISALERNQFPEEIVIQYGTITLTYKGTSGISPEQVILPPPTVKASFKKLAVKT